MNKKRDQKAFFQFIASIKSFFFEKEFLEVLTPSIVQNPGMETHIHPFKVASAFGDKIGSHYLRTSPEFHMKELLSEGLNDIYTISYSFRDEPDSETHRSQFLMLEWYRNNSYYQKIKEDCQNLLNHLCAHTNNKEIKIQHVSVQEIIQEFCKFDILNFLSSGDLRKKIEKDLKTVPLPQEELAWDDYFFLIFLNLIEPELSKFEAIILDKYPAPLSALSTISKDDLRVCERFELYLDGVEIANCFNELTDLKIQKERFDVQNSMKKNLYSYKLPEPIDLYNALEKGLPKSSGIALGVERLYANFYKEQNPFWD